MGKQSQAFPRLRTGDHFQVPLAYICAPIIIQRRFEIAGIMCLIIVSPEVPVGLTHVHWTGMNFDKKGMPVKRETVLEPNFARVESVSGYQVE